MHLPFYLVNLYIKMTEIIVKIIFNTLNFLNLLHLICPSREIGFGGYKKCYTISSSIELDIDSTS